MNPTLENAWREISPYLDEVLELEGDARRRWLDELKARSPATALALRSWLVELDRLKQRNFLGLDVASAVSAAGLAGQRFGSYTLERALGHGGMGSVWLARRSDGRFEGEVAIKLLNASLVGRAGEERFRREGHVLAKLEHPNIARLVDAGVSASGQPYLVLEYVRGQPIDLYCNTARLDVRARIELFLDVLAAVSHAHSRLVIHRDLKPANIFVTATGTLKLLDFGIAKLIAEEGAGVHEKLTHHGYAPRTLTYASPEQIKSVDIGTASDVYSLGVLLYELMTGVLPYFPKRDTLGALEEEILSAQPVAPSRAGFSEVQASERNTTAKKLSKLLRGDLDAIVLTALKKAQSDRYATAAAFGEDLKRSLRSEPILARGESSWYRIRKFASRNKLPVLAAATSLVALLVGLGVALWQASVARAQAARAEEISHFIESVFEDADPTGSGSEGVRAVDLLMRARTRVEEELTGRGPLQQELLCTIGSSLYGLGAQIQARRTFERITELIGRIPTQLGTLPTQCLIDYADLLTIIGEYASADAILRVLEKGDRSHSPDLLTGKTLEVRATWDLNLDKAEAALKDAARGNEIVHALTLRGSRDSLEAALALARVQYVTDRNAEALATAERALTDRASNPRAAPRTKGVYLELRSLRARSLAAVGRQDEAAREYAALVPELRLAFGSDTHQFGVDLYEYSIIEQRRGELRHAIGLGEQALAAAKSGGSSDRSVAAASFGLAMSFLLAENASAGLAWASNARTLHEATFGTDDAQGHRYRAIAIFAGGLGGDPTAAAAQLQPVIDRQRADDPRYLPRLLWFQGDLYLHAGKFAEAAAQLAEAEKLAMASEINQRFQLPMIRADLGRALFNLGKFDAAAGKLQAALSGEGVPHTMMPAQAHAQVGLARLLLLRNDPRGALLHAAAAADFWDDFDPRNPARKEAEQVRSDAQRAETAFRDRRTTKD